VQVTTQLKDKLLQLRDGDIFSDDKGPYEDWTMFDHFVQSFTGLDKAQIQTASGDDTSVYYGFAPMWASDPPARFTEVPIPDEWFPPLYGKPREDLREDWHPTGFDVASWRTPYGGDNSIHLKFFTNHEGAVEPVFVATISDPGSSYTAYLFAEGSFK
jgi:hypothetical protein